MKITKIELQETNCDGFSNLQINVEGQRMPALQQVMPTELATYIKTLIEKDQEYQKHCQETLG